MGAVVAAHQLQLDEKVALKFLLPNMLAHQESVIRFANEARRARKIKSDHVAQVHDVGPLENGAPYMVMEYRDGADLATLLQRQGPLPFEEAVDFVLQASEAIAEAHSLDIVYRDLKPANLFCLRRLTREHPNFRSSCFSSSSYRASPAFGENRPNLSSVVFARSLDPELHGHPTLQ